MGFTFFGTIVCYNFVKYGVEAEKYLIVYNSYHKSIQVFSFLCAAAAFYFLIHIDRKIWFGILVLGIISTLYAIPFLPRARNLRSLGGLKIYIVALVWVGFTAVLPILDNGLEIARDFYVLFLQRFILVLVLLIPFEIRDLQWDDPKIRTLPQVFGEYKTRVLGIVLTLFFFFLTLFKDNVSLDELLSRLLISILLICVFLSGRMMQHKYFASFWIEGIPMLWFAMLWLPQRFC